MQTRHIPPTRLKDYPLPLPEKPLELRQGTYQGIPQGYFHILGSTDEQDHADYGIALDIPFVLVSDGAAIGRLYPAQYDPNTDNWTLLGDGIQWKQGKIEHRLPLNAPTFEAHYYTVTDEAITPTGKVETFTAKDRDEAVMMAIYTHRLHNGNAYGTPHGVIHCPSCGQIAIVNRPQPAELPNAPTQLSLF